MSTSSSRPDRVIIDPDVEGLGVMLGDLIRGNIAADPTRAKLLEGVRGTINIRAHDAEVAVGMELIGGTLRVHARPFDRPDLDVSTDADTLMGMSTVPLRLGMPDVSTSDGRAVVRKMFRRELKVRGMLLHPALLARLQRLLSVA